MHIQQEHRDTEPGKALLEGINDLRDSIEAAVLAISEDSLEALEESLWKQQVLCASLQRSITDVQGVELNPTETRDVASAATSARDVSATFTELLRQAGSSAHLLLQLCTNYSSLGDGTPQATGINPFRFEA